jgi:hypothetical protein
MSHIPNSAMPHAGDTAELERKEASGPSFKERAGKIAETARAHPKTTVAAGAAVIAGVAAAAAIPLVRGRKSSGTKSNASKRKNSGRSSS